MKIIIYTTILGDYDNLHELPASTVEAYCFTNNSAIESKSWTTISDTHYYETNDDRVRQCRKYKMLPHLYFPDADIWIWSDASFRWLTDPTEAVQYLGVNDIATFKYPDIYGERDCIYQEAEACILRKKDNDKLIKRQMNKYKDKGYREHLGLAETTLLIRRNTPDVRAFNELWWQEIKEGSRRDQLSFNFINWSLGMEYSILPGYRLKSDFGIWVNHKENIYV